MREYEHTEFELIYVGNDPVKLAEQEKRLGADCEEILKRVGVAQLSKTQ